MLVEVDLYFDTWNLVFTRLRVITRLHVRTSVHEITRVDAITCTGVISSVHVTCKDNFNNTAFHRCVTCVCARSGSRLTEGVSEAWCWGNCHRSCRFWTVYSRIMMTFKQTRLLSSLYLYTSAPCIRFIHLEPGTVYWDMTPPRKKKGILLWRSAPCIRFIHL